MKFVSWKVPDAEEPKEESLPSASYLENIQKGLTNAPRNFYRRINNANVLNKLLKRAAEKGDTKKVEFLLRCSLAHVEGYPRQTSPLFRAAMCAQVETVRLLLARGADPRRLCRGIGHAFGCVRPRWDEGLSTALHAAAGFTKRISRHGFHLGYAPEEEFITRARECCQLLVDAGCDVNDTGYKLYTPLHLSVGSKMASVADLLLEKGANPHMSTRTGYTTAGLIDGSAASVPTIEVLIKHGYLVDLSLECDGNIPILTIVQYYAPEYDPVALAPFVSDWNVADQDGSTPLHFEAGFGYRGTGISHLIDLGADVRRKNTLGKEPLHMVKAHSRETIKILLDAGAELEAKDNEGCTLLLVVMDRMAGYLNKDNFDDIENLILEFHPDVNAIDNHGNGIFHKMCDWFDVTGLRKLQELGTNPLHVNNAGETILHTFLKGKTVREGNPVLEGVKWLMDAGLTSMHQDYMGNTPLHALCATRLDLSFWDKEWPDWEAADYLLSIEEGKACHVKNKEGYQPIHLAAANSKILVWKLISLGVSATTRTNDGKGLLHIAAAARQGNIVGFLLDHYRASRELEYELDQTDNTGSTPLHLACRSGCFASVELLTNAGADLDARDAAGLTPMEVCSKLIDQVAKTFAEGDVNDDHIKFKDVYLGHQPNHKQNDAGQMMEVLCFLASMTGKSPPLRDGGHTLVEEDPNCSHYNSGHERGLFTGDYGVFKRSLASGVRFRTKRRKDIDFMSRLANGGYYYLFCMLGDSRHGKRWLNGNEEVPPYLLTAAARNEPNMPILRALVEKFGANTNVMGRIESIFGNGQSGYKCTALHLFARGYSWWQEGAVAYLLEHGADPNLRDTKGKTPLHLAVIAAGKGAYMAKPIIGLLLEHGANPGVADNEGLSLLDEKIEDHELSDLLRRYTKAE